LRKWNMLSSKVVYFEQKNGGAFRGASEYPREALATVNTHDHAPVAGFWRERDIEMRSALGSLPVKAARSARKQRIREKEQLLALLAAEGLLTDHSGDDEAELIHAVHAFARRTPCWLVGLSLDDLAAESEPVNIPGVPIERHRSWSRKMSVDLEELLFAPRTAYLLGEERRWRK
jgi:4-alpha-glucanotransferase